MQTQKNICKSLKILMIDDIIDLELAKISYRYSNKLLPGPVQDLFQSNDFSHTYNTRARNHPRIEKHKSAVFNKSFLCRAPALWTSLPTNIRTKNKKPAFSLSYKNFKLTTY